MNAATCPLCGWPRGHDYGCPRDPLNPGIVQLVEETKRYVNDLANWREDDSEALHEAAWQSALMTLERISDLAASPSAPAASSEDARDADLHTFINGAAGDGLVIDGIDAADLYVKLWPERYAAAIAATPEAPK